MNKRSSISSLWLLLRKPQSEMRRVLKQGSGFVVVPLMILLGMQIILVSADVFNLGSTVGIGRVVSATIIFGPILGLIYTVLLSACMTSLGCLFDPNHRPNVTKETIRPWFPLRKLIVKIFFRGNHEKFWKATVPSVYQKFMTWNYSVWIYFKSSISGGVSSFSSVFIANAWAYIPFLFLFGWTVIEFMMGDASNLLKDTPGVSIWGWRGFSFILKFGILAWYVIIVTHLNQQAFRLTWAKAIGTTSISLIISGFVLWLLLKFTFGMLT